MSKADTVDELEQWSAIETKAEAVELYAAMQQASLNGIKTNGDIPAINTILISKFGMQGLNDIKKRAVKRLK